MNTRLLLERHLIHMGIFLNSLKNQSPLSTIRQQWITTLDNSLLNTHSAHLSLHGAGTVANGEPVDTRVLHLHAHKHEGAIFLHILGIIGRHLAPVEIPRHCRGRGPRDLRLKGHSLSFQGHGIGGKVLDDRFGRCMSGGKHTQQDRS